MLKNSCSLDYSITRACLRFVAVLFCACSLGLVEPAGGHEFRPDQFGQRHAFQECFQGETVPGRPEFPVQRGPAFSVCPPGQAVRFGPGKVLDQHGPPAKKPEEGVGRGTGKVEGVQAVGQADDEIPQFRPQFGKGNGLAA